MNKRKVFSNGNDSVFKRGKIAKGNNSEEKVIKYYFVPSLQFVSGVAIVENCFSRKSRETVAGKLGLENRNPRFAYSGIWENIKRLVLEEITQLNLPTSIKKTLLQITESMSDEILSWLKGENRIFPVTVDYICDFAWTSRGTIDSEKTAVRLMSRNDLSDAVKFYISCENCLEEYIFINAQELPNIIDEGCVPQSLLLFWKGFIIGDTTEFDTLLRNKNALRDNNSLLSADGLLCLKAISKGNDIAAKHFWSKLSPEEKTRHIIEFTVKASNKNVPMLFFLLSQMNAEQQARIFQEHSLCILSCFLNKWLWEDYFLPTVHHVWDMVSDETRISILTLIVDEVPFIFDANDKNRLLFKQLWKSSGDHVKRHFINERIRDVDSIIWRFLKSEDLKMIHLIFSAATVEQRKQLASDIALSGVWIKWDLLKPLINQNISEECMEEFKKKFQMKQAACVCLPLIDNSEWETLQNFLNWCFKSDDEIFDFKRSLVDKIYDYMVRATLVGDLFSEDELYFMKFDKFISWCFTSEKESRDFKMNILLQPYTSKIKFLENMCLCIRNDKFLLVDMILNWCFSDDQDKISQYKNNENSEIYNHGILSLLLGRDGDLRLIKKLVDWGFSSEEQVQKFKEEKLQQPDGMFDICKDLLYQFKFESLDDVLLWFCTSSKARVNKLKNEMFISRNVQLYLMRSREHHLASYIEWFNPSSVAIEEYKSRFVCDSRYHTFTSILEDFSQRQDIKIKQSDRG